MHVERSDTAAPNALPGLVEAASEALRRVWPAYPAFIPAIIVTFLFVDLVAPAKHIPWHVVEILLFALCAPAYAAGAARAAGRWPDSAFWLYVQRASATFLSLFFLAVIPMGLALVLGGVAFALRAAHSDAALEALAAGWAVVVLWLVTRLWPVFVIAYVYRGRSRWSVAARGLVWDGPGLGTAWRMTARRGSWLRVQLPMGLLALAPLGAWLAAHGALRDLGGRSLVDVLIYAGLLPFATTVLDVYAQALRVPTRWDRYG